MSDHPSEVHEYPGGLKENPGGRVPLPLKLTYVGFVTFGALYWFLFHTGPGTDLVREFNRLTGAGG